jgi:hypothetical protein
MRAVMPSKVDCGEGELRTRFQPNAKQRWLLKLWKKMCKDVGEVDVCVVNGDCCDGVNYKDHGYDLWTTDLDTQIESARILLSMVNAKKYIVTQGSGYHVGQNMSLDQLVARALKGQFGQDVAIRAKEAGVRMHFSHFVGVSTSSWQYRTTPIARELVSALLNEKEYGKYHAVIRSHAHYYCYVEFGSHFGLITPAWQLRTPYMINKGLSLLPKIGYVVLYAEDGSIWKERHLWSIKNPVKEVAL